MTVSEELFSRALKVVPGGVNSPVRAFRAVGGHPRFMVKGEGPYLTDADGKRYVDLPAPLHEVGALLEARAVHTGRSARNHLLALALTVTRDPTEIRRIVDTY